MAYQPFYIVPVEFQEHQQKQEAEVRKGGNLVEWQKHDIEEPNRFFNILVSIAFVVPNMIFFYFIGFWDGDWLSDIIYTLVALFGYSISYYMVGVDYQYTYIMSNKGFVLKKRRNIPIWMNKVVQVTAWCAAIFCILMVGVAGPMILVGAGGAILFAFGMLKKQPDEPIEVTAEPIEHLICARYNKQRKLIKLYLKLDVCEFGDASKTTVSRYHGADSCYLFFSTTNQLEKLLNTFQNELMIPCEEIDDPKRLFTPKDAPTEFLEVPYRDSEFPVSEAQSLRNSKAPLPNLLYRQ
ncbi:hypothetical protein ACP3V5_00850 [Vibrio maritimus]